MNTTSETATEPGTEGMSIAKFCRQRRLPQRRVLRLVKAEVLRHAGKETADDWHADLSDEIGVVARRDAGSVRISYDVADPDVLLEWCARQVGVALLTEGELAHVVEAARSYYELAMGKNEKFVITSRNTGGKFNPNEEGYFGPLDKALRRMGA